MSTTTKSPRVAIVNVANGHWYPRGAARLIESLKPWEWAVSPRMWINTYPRNSPTHEQSPYVFKTYAMAEVFRDFDVLLWVDASCWCVRDPSPLIAHIMEHGYYMQANGPAMGEWCSDEALKIFGITREESMKIPEISTMVMGINTRRVGGEMFLCDWIAMGTRGAFRGPHTNGATGRNPGFCSDDPRVKGHRHDQTAASFIAHRLGMVGIPRPKFVAYDADGNANDTTIFLSRGL